MNRILAFLLVALLIPAEGSSKFAAKILSNGQDPSDTANFVYCTHQAVLTGPGKISATASTTLNVTADTGPITSDADVGEGSEVTFTDTAGTFQRRSVTSKTASTLVISGAAVTVATGTSYSYAVVDCGTGAEAGWTDVSDYSGVTVQTIVTTKGAATIDMQIEGRIVAPNASTTIILTKTYSTTTSDLIPIMETMQQLRVGWKPSGAGTDSVSGYVGLLW